MNKVPEQIDAILEALESAGYEAYLVGGCVRDMLLGRPIRDWDIATDAHCKEVGQIFPKTLATGIRYGTVTVFSGSARAEVTTFRSDGAYSDGRRPESVEFLSRLSEDLERRDFTMNALAISRQGVVTDIFGGAEDIKKQLIRCVGEPEKRFSEDALRMFRTLRFSAELGFSIESKTLEAIKKLSASAQTLSAERICGECEKILMSQRPQVLGEAVSLGLLDKYLSRPGPDKEVLLEISLLPGEKRQRWSALAAALMRCGAVPDAKEFLRALRLDSRTVSMSGASAEIAAEAFPENRRDIKRLFFGLGVPTSLMAAASAKVLGDLSAEIRAGEVLESGECFSLKTLAVSGGDLKALGIREGAEIGRILGQLMEHVFAHPEDNRREKLIETAEIMHRKQVQV